MGFAIDAGLLWALVGTGIGPLAARLASAAVAIGICWLVNRGFTFAADGWPGMGEGAKYYAVYAAGFLVNYLTYTLALLGPFDQLGGQPEAMLALACGSAVALFFHYSALRLWVYRA